MVSMPDKLQGRRVRHIKSKLRPVTKSSISDKIVDQIMSLIASGDLKPGQRLPAERELCQHFGAGRSSLREALRCLCIVGVLTARAGEGTSVASDGGKFLGKIVEWRIITEQHDIEDLMQVRIALESVTAASAARLASKEDLAKLDLLLARMEAAVVEERRFAALDLEFHVTLAAASENFLIYDLVSMIRGQFAKALTRVLLLPNARPLSLQEHVSIINAIQRRDPEAASKAMQDHLEAVRKRYHSALASSRLLPSAFSQPKLSPDWPDKKGPKRNEELGFKRSTS
jgi:GntR family transcriptional regulator, transcriptional repressor for pyruvate dehydrogenase complex